MTAPLVRDGGSLVVHRAAGGDGLSVEGVSVPWYAPVLIWDSWDGNYWEQFDPKAVEQTLREALPQMLWGHGRDVTGQVPIGAWQTMRPDSTGLRSRGVLFDNELVRPVRDAIAGGAPLGQSISFFPEADRVEPNYRDGYPLITRTRVRLDEVSIVRRPAYPTTTIGMSAGGAAGRELPAELAELLARNERHRQAAEVDALRYRYLRKAPR